MKFHRIALSLFILLARFISTGFAQSGISEDLRIEYTTEVFREGEKNYLFFRIPSLLFSGKIIYAFCEGRKNSLADHGQIDIVLKKSGDFGRTWGDLMIVTAIYDQSCQNPTPIYIQEDDKIILLFTKRTVATDTEDQIRSGTASGYAGAYSAVSLDQGRTWSEILEITDQVKLENWRWYAFGPGGAIHINNAELYKGRIIVPANHSIAGSNGNELLGAHVVYSDDNGKSWHIGATDSEGVGTVNPNELTVAETESGTLYFNARSQNNDPDPVSNRAITYSGDGGITFARKFLHEPQLITPVVHASLARLGNRLMFIAPNDPSVRKDLSLWISEDETLTWKGPWVIHNGFTAYSSSVKLDKWKSGILFETGLKNPYERILFKLIGMD